MPELTDLQLDKLRLVANFTLDGEKGDDGEPYGMSIDAAFQTAHDAVTLVREVVGKEVTDA